MAGRLASRSDFVQFVAWLSTVHDADYEHAGFDFVVGLPSDYYLGLLWRGWMYAPCDHISIRRSASDAGSSKHIPWSTQFYQYALRQEAETRARPLGCADRKQTAEEFTCISTATGQAFCHVVYDSSNSGAGRLMCCRAMCCLCFAGYSDLRNVAVSTLYMFSALGGLLRLPAAASVTMRAQTSCRHMHTVRGCSVCLPCL